MSEQYIPKWGEFFVAKCKCDYASASAKYLMDKHGVATRDETFVHQDLLEDLYDIQPLMDISFSTSDVGVIVEAAIRADRAKLAGLLGQKPFLINLTNFVALLKDTPIGVGE